jgi:hypothetical protein
MQMHTRSQSVYIFISFYVLSKHILCGLLKHAADLLNNVMMIKHVGEHMVHFMRTF